VTRLVRISSASKRILVRATDRTDVDIDGSATLLRSGEEIRIDAIGSLTVLVPEGTDVVIGVASGRIETRGALGAVCVVSESGRVDIESADAVDVRTRSSRVRVRSVAGAATVRTDSGNVTIDRCGAATVSTESGRIECRDAHGDVRAHCVSGRISIDMAVAADVVAETVSGRVSVTFPAAVGYRRVGIDELPNADVAGTVAAHSVSGRVEVSSR